MTLLGRPIVHPGEVGPERIETVVTGEAIERLWEEIFGRTEQDLRDRLSGVVEGEAVRVVPEERRIEP